MGVTDWFRRLFSPDTGSADPEDEAILREEYGGEASASPGPGMAGGVSGLAGLEDAEAADDAVRGDEPR